MAFFSLKTWKQRIVEFPGRRRLDDTSSANVYDVSRAEGNIIQEGDGFTAANMNDLEQRIHTAINNIETELNKKPKASGVDYDNASSGLAANTVQGAIDENAADIKAINSNIDKLNDRNSAKKTLSTLKDLFESSADGLSVFISIEQSIDIPEKNSRWYYGIGTILRRDNLFAVVTLYAYGTNQFAINSTVDAGNTWNGWKIYQ